MASDVKRPRPYNSPSHREQRQRTRRAILDAAQTLFHEDGYGTTTIESIGSRAGVATATVYAVFGNKRSILWALLEISVAGDDDQANIAERLTTLVAGVDDAPTRIARIVRFGGGALARSARLHRVLRSAAAVDTELRATLEQAEAARYKDAVTMAELILGRDASGDDVRCAADTINILTSYEVWDLAQAHGWNTQQWEQWVTQTLTNQLL